MLAYTRCDRVVAFILVCSICLTRVHSIRDIFQIEDVKQGDVQNGGAAGHLLPKGCEDAYVHNPKARESQSCSLGLTKPFVGPLDTWTSIRAMLQARSHNGEVIVTHENRIDIAAQWQWRMLKMGYAHTIIVTRGEYNCVHLRKLFGDHVGCAWFAHSVSYTAAFVQSEAGGAVPGTVQLFLEEPFFWRLQLAAMILRVGGYNVLMLDTDTVLLDDFYWWIDQPDLKGYQLLSQYDGMGTLNVGVMYARSTAPSGPTAWALAESVLRNVRWKENVDLMRRLNVSSTICWDQSVVTDSVYSALVGRPLFWRCLMPRTLDPSWDTREDGSKLYQQSNDALISPALKVKVFATSRSGPACHQPFVGPRPIKSWEGLLHAPHSGGRWPPELGGAALGEMGPRARAFVKMMAEAGTPMWPDPEDPSAASAAASIPPERFSYLSRHIVCDWSSCGSNGLYQPQLRSAGEEPCVVIGHFVVSPDTTPGKRFVVAQTGHYSLPLAQLELGPGGAFFATNAHIAGITHFGAMRAAARHGKRGQQSIPLPHVLTLAPGALSPSPSASPSAPGAVVLRDKAHMITLVGALASVAVATGRTLGLPRLSCDYPWMHRGPEFPFNGSHSVPWRYLEAEAFAPFGPSLGNLSCEWYGWVQQGCFHGPLHLERGPNDNHKPHPAARMLLSYELDYLLSQLPPDDRAPVHPTSTLGMDSTTIAAAAALAANANALDPAAAAAGSSLFGLGRHDVNTTLVKVPAGAPAPGPDGVVNITMAQLTWMLGGLRLGAPVVWLEAPMRVVDLPGPQATVLQQWTQQCCGLSWPQSYNHICFWKV